MMRTLLFAALALASAGAAIAQPPPAGAPGAPGGMGAPSDPWPGKKKLLVVADVQTGFQHDSINHAMAVIERLGRESGKWVAFLRTDSQLVTKQPIKGQGARYAGRPVNARTLDFFDGVFFLGSGEGTMTEQQKADLLAFVKEDGKGFVAGHAATVALYNWPAFGQMIGPVMASEYRVDTMALMNVDRAFPGAAAFPAAFDYRDQYVVMPNSFSSKDAHVILRLDPRRLTAEQLSRRPDGDFPLVWAKQEGKGRVYNLSLGHEEQLWDDPKFQQLAAGGIAWALGLEKADATPGNSQPPALLK